MKKYLFLLAFVLPSIVFASIDTNLKYGARGQEVAELQEFLISKGFLAGQATGNFFSLTQKAVIAYQASVGVPSTGFVGLLTRAKVNAELATNIAPATSAEISETGTITPPAQNSPTELLRKQIELLMQQVANLQKPAPVQSASVGTTSVASLPVTKPQFILQEIRYDKDSDSIVFSVNGNFNRNYGEYFFEYGNDANNLWKTKIQYASSTSIDFIANPVVITIKTPVNYNNQAVALRGDLYYRFVIRSPITGTYEVGFRLSQLEKIMIDSGACATTSCSDRIKQASMQLTQVAPTSTTQAMLEITSINVSSTFNTMTFEWSTNKPTDSRVFVSGDSIAARTFSSESGKSTHHLATAINLNGNTNYSYEIEAIANNEVAKKNGSFSTKQVKENAQLQISVIGGDCNSNNWCEIEVQYLENGERANASAITISSDDSGFFTCASYPGKTCIGGVATDSSGSRQGNPMTGYTRPSGSDGKPIAYFHYVPSGERAEPYTRCTDGTPSCTVLRIRRILTVIANGVVKTYELVTFYHPL